MIRYCSPPGNPVVAANIAAGVLDAIDTPAQGNVIGDGWGWMGDNGCYGDGYPGNEGIVAWWAKISARAATCRFVTAPDVVGDAAATLARSADFLPVIAGLGMRPAVVAQNGLELIAARWTEAEAARFWGQAGALFLGGLPECVPCQWIRPVSAGPVVPPLRERCPLCTRRLTEWKMGAAARALAAQAKQRGLWVHMGRVSSLIRLLYAARIGCDSVDGTHAKFKPEETVPEILRWVAAAEADRHQEPLWPIGAR